MRITFITTKINFERAGGSVPDLDLKVRDMQALGAEVRVVTVFSEHNLLPPLPYPVHDEHTPNKSLPALQKNILNVLRKYERDSDVFHIEGQFAYAAGWYRMRGGKPIVAFFNREMLVWERGGLKRAFRRIVEQLLYRLVVPYIDYCYFTTPQLLQKYVQFGLQMPQDRTSAILDFFDAEKIRSRAKTEQPSTDTLQIFASGRMIREKGFDLLIDALALLPEQARDKLKVTIGGNGPEREKLMLLAKERRANISFPGWLGRDEFWDAFSTADVFVLPRWQIEQPSVIVMEALALCIPTVAPCGGGVEWMARDAIAGFANDDTRSLSDSLNKVIASKSERDLLVAAAAKRVPEIDHLANRERLYAILESVAMKG